MIGINVQKEAEMLLQSCADALDNNKLYEALEYLKAAKVLVEGLELKKTVAVHLERRLKGDR